jgi:type III restriction enzyme
VLDEAHRGFNTKTSSDKPTIVRRLVNGIKSTRPPIPIVWHLGHDPALRDSHEGS